jgi:hypothetical protein
METGRLKVFNTLPNWRGEYRRYHRHLVKTETTEKVIIAKVDDHLMDAMRMLENDWAKVAGIRPVPGGNRSSVSIGDRAAGY